MRTFHIKHPDEGLRAAIRAKIDNLNKPKGSLGRLESLSEQICMVQQTLSPALRHPCHLLLGGDHGIEREGVSVSPREVTWQQMINFTRGGGGVNLFCRQHGFDLRIVDVGVDHDLSGIAGISDRKISYGTRNFRYGPAMSAEELSCSFDIGAQLVDDCSTSGCNILCLGEMGIGNTSPSSIWMSLFGGIPLDECIGAGAGLNTAGIAHKRKVLQACVEKFWRQMDSCEPGAEDRGQEKSSRSGYCLEDPTTRRPDAPILEIIRYFGGFEMTVATGAMLRAAERDMLIMVDGFIMTACMLAASRLYPAVLDYAIFCHCGNEGGHARMLGLMEAEPLLHLGLRLGEGTGALCAYPLIDSAVRMMNEMNNFDDANITKYF